MAVNAAKQMRGSSPGRPAVPAGDPILTAMITAPDVPDWAVQRPRITSLIVTGTRWCPLTVVTGPAGAGKTMALALWAADAPGPVAWVCLDEYNARPGAFWRYVLAALRRSGVAIPRIPDEGGRAAEKLFPLRLAEALAAQAPPVTLVLDDFHLLTEPRVLNGLDFLLRSVGSGLRLVAASRSDPLLPLHRYRLAGQLAEIRGAELAFDAAEATLLLAQHRCGLSADALDLLLRQTEGWAAGLRLAALSMARQPDPDGFVGELLGQESDLTGYLAQEILDAQPPEVRELLLRTSILEHVSAEAASELAGSGDAGRVLAALARANAFVEPIGRGRYRYHTLFAQMLRRRLSLECPARAAALHRQAARWYGRNGQLTDAVRHAARVGDWPLAAGMVVDALAIGELIHPVDSPSLAGEFAAMPPGGSWPEPQPYLVCAAMAESAGRTGAAAAALDEAERILDRTSADRQATARLAAAMIRLAASRRSGHLGAAEAAIARAEAVAGMIPAGSLAGHAGIRAEVLAARGEAELWSGRFDAAVRILESGIAAAAVPGGERGRAACLGHLALAEALRGQLIRAVRLADQATRAPSAGGPAGAGPSPAALVALAWADLQHHDQRQVRIRLKQVDAALAVSPDKLIGAIARLIAAYSALSEGRGSAAAHHVARARSGWVVPAWLNRALSLAGSRASLPAGQIGEAPAVAGWAAAKASLEAAPAVAPLTEREREVLRHLSGMLTTAEIASELYISANTVKSHIKNICHKLAASHRGEAVRKARQLQLI